MADLSSGNAGGGLHRSRSHQIWCLSIAGLCAVVALGAIVTAAGRAHPLAQLGLALVFAGLSAAGVRWSRAAVDTSDAQALVIRNPLRTHVIPWAQVSGFEIATSRMPNEAGPRRLVKVKLNHGASITCVGACAWGGEAALRMTTELNRAHDWSTTTPLTDQDRDTIARLQAAERTPDEP